MITNIKTAKEFIKQTLEAEIQKLPQEERLPVEFPVSFDNYELNHPLGSYLIIYRGGEYSKSKTTDVLTQDRDLEFAVIAVTRKTSGSPVPEERLEFVVDTLSGIGVESFDRYDKIYCKNDELLKEENGVWYYGTIVTVPVEFIEKEYRNG